MKRVKLYRRNLRVWCFCKIYIPTTYNVGSVLRRLFSTDAIPPQYWPASAGLSRRYTRWFLETKSIAKMAHHCLFTDVRPLPSLEPRLELYNPCFLKASFSHDSRLKEKHLPWFLSCFLVVTCECLTSLVGNSISQLMI